MSTTMRFISASVAGPSVHTNGSRSHKLSDRVMKPARAAATRRSSSLAARGPGNLLAGMAGTTRVQPAGTYSQYPAVSLTAGMTMEYGGGFGGAGGSSGGGGWGGDSHRWGEGNEDESAGSFLSWLQQTLTTIMRYIGMAYSTLSQKFPMATSGLMTAFSMSLAECIIQLAIMRQPELSGEPLLRTLAYGFFVKGPLLSVFYGALNKAITCRKGMNLLKLLFLDCVVGSFAFTSVYAFVMPLLKGCAVPEAAQNVKDKVVGLWMVGLKVWPAAMTLNYLLLPPSLQVPYILGVDVICNVAIGLKASSTIDCAKIEACMATGQPVSNEQIEVVDVMVDAPLVDAIHALEEQFGSDVELAPSLV